jgi:hypothetical protein
MGKSSKRTAVYAGVLPALTVGVVYGVVPGYLIVLPLVGIVFTAVAAGAPSMADMGDVLRYSVGLFVWSAVVLVVSPVLL